VPNGVHHPQNGTANPKYKLLCFLTTNFFGKVMKALAFNGNGAAI
jgi:hypothetical protein